MAAYSPSTLSSASPIALGGKVSLWHDAENVVRIRRPEACPSRQSSGASGGKSTIRRTPVAPYASEMRLDARSKLVKMLGRMIGLPVLEIVQKVVQGQKRTRVVATSGQA